MRNPFQAEASRRGMLLAEVLACLFILAFAAVMHAPVFLQGKTVSPFDLTYYTGAYRSDAPADWRRPENVLMSDPITQFQPWDLTMREGSVNFPWLWNPYAGCGSPLLANSQSAPFWPLKAVYSPAGARRGFGFHSFLKMALAGLLMWLFLRTIGVGFSARALGAVAFMSCGFMVVWLQWPHTNVALCFPLLMLGSEFLAQGKFRKGGMAVVAATVFGFLGGHPETLFHTTFSAGLYLTARGILAKQKRDGWRRRVGGTAVMLVWFGLAVMLGAVIVAAQLLPSLEYIGQSSTLAERAFSPTRFSWSSLSLGNPKGIGRRLLPLFLPDIYGNPATNAHWRLPFSNYNEMAGYVGIGMLLLSALGWRFAARREHILPLGLLQILSLGFVVRAPLITKTLGLLPLFNVALNKRFILILSFTLVSMGCMALDEWTKTSKRKRLDMIILAVLAGLVLFPGLYEWAVLRKDANLWQRFGMTAQFARYFMFLGSGIALLAAARYGRSWIQKGCKVAWIALVAADLYSVFFGYNPFVDPAKVFPKTEALAFLKSKQPARVLPISAHIPPGSLGVYGIQDLCLYDGVKAADFEALMAALRGKAVAQTMMSSLVHVAPTPITARAGVRYLFADPDWKPATKTLKLVYEDRWSRIYEDPDAWPHAYVASTWRAVNSPKEAFERLAGRSREDFGIVIEPLSSEQSLPAAPDTDLAPARAAIVEYASTRVSIELPPKATGVLVLNDLFYPGWNARVDNEPRPLYCVNGVFRGVFVGTGDRNVVFEFSPQSFRIGGWLSCAGILLCVFAAVLGIVRLVFPRRVTLLIPTLSKDKQADHFPKLKRLLAEDLPGQTYSNYEAIVYCDGPNRQVDDMAASLRDKRIRVFHTATTLAKWGNPQTRLGIAKARGDLFVRMNDDNRPNPDYLETLVKGFQGRPSVGLVYGRVIFEEEAADEHSNALDASRIIPKDKAGTLAFQNIDCMCFMARRGVAKKYAESWNDEFSADWFFVEALLRHGVKTRFCDKLIGRKY